MVEKVLILEDDESLREVFADCLDYTYKVKTVLCDSFQSMVAKASEVLECEVAFLDINLGPNRPTGIEAYHWLLKNGFKGQIVFLTGHGKFDPLIREALKLNRAAMLTKPARMEDIEKFIKTGKTS